MSQAGNVSTNNPNIPLTFVTNAGSASASANILNVLGGSGVTTSGSGNTITVVVSSGGFTWNSVTSTSPLNPITLTTENAYICNGTPMVTFVLPASPTIGDYFIIISNTSRFRINENANQQICIGSVSATATSGTATSNSIGDMVELTYVGVNSGVQIFRSTSVQGIITLS